ncbi:MAG: Asp-tRNA(Asn)/Glu-tRNA(Gln) amidotransferase subunit GatB [Candidatus Diapherotrites archaeon]|nr:Asp-tRNA(Asn)/Glu-tRNA(Gln) amidotransferase subunit GatB [Candidatus Diapherotrites archaeon]
MSEKKPKAIIGLEVHVQLNTNSKLFCSCPTDAEEPNTACCEICLGMPGSKPKLNEKALEFALRIALALNCKINREFFFSRKVYFYPDMAKNFQITQYEVPLAEKGFIELQSGRKISIRRVHIEEDPASLIHEANYSLIDYNRSGIPLVEIVTEPQLRSAAEAKEFLDSLIKILEYLEVFDSRRNTIKADVNISLEGSERVEIKNISGRKAIEAALEFEESRQRSLIAEGKKIERETRGFNAEKGITFTLREKEFEEDYGYIFEPDLTKFKIAKEFLEKVKREIPELHIAKAKRLQEEFSLPKNVAETLAGEKALAELFEFLTKKINPELAASFLTRELLAILNRDNLKLAELDLDAKEIAEMLVLLQENKITEKTAKEAMINYVHKKETPKKFIERNNLLIEFDTKEIEDIVDAVFAEHKKAVDDYKKGKKEAINFLVGQVMRIAKGKAEPRIVRKIIIKKLRGGKQ